VSETEINLFQLLKEFWNYFSIIEHVGEYSWAAICQVSMDWNKIISDGRRRRL